jgi:hypothetical protein
MLILSKAYNHSHNQTGQVRCVDGCQIGRSTDSCRHRSRTADFLEITDDEVMNEMTRDEALEVAKRIANHPAPVTNQQAKRALIKLLLMKLENHLTPK